MTDAPAISLAMPVTRLPGIGPARAERFARLGIERASDLLRHYPLRYEHEREETDASELVQDSVGCARGMLLGTRWVGGGWGRRGKGRFEATLQDKSGTVSLVWFNAAYLQEKLHPGLSVRVQGKVKSYGGYPQMVNPKWEIIEEDVVEVRDEKLRPVYPSTESLPSPVIEQAIAAVLPALAELIDDPLPPELVQHHNMPALADAFRWIHQPEEPEQAAAARRRLAFNELLLVQLGIALKRAYVENELQAPALRHSEAIDQHIRERFPFELTPDQDAVVKELAEDLQRGRPMNRLLQGDVGSGKTVVALYALLMAVADGRQGALMAPTELLAEQHYLSIHRMLEGANVRIELLTGGRAGAGSAERKQLEERIAAGEVDIVVGTHAMLSESVRFRELAVAVIDEQHRFGVKQRAGFRTSHGAHDPAEGGKPAVPHTLVMTATPIPRTLSLTVFGDLDVSTIRHLPPGRTPIANRVVQPAKADEVYAYVQQKVERGEQAYVVVPAIDANEGDDGGATLKSVREHAASLRETLGEGVTVAEMHGRLSRDEREVIMQQFRRGEVDVLVATTVIEVGVDVPNATVMVIEHAERFGLAQLHQLRGRVGRGTEGKQSVCVFISSPATDDARKRMDAIASTNDGFRVAELDLEIRGMGEFFGTRQSGALPLRIAQIPDDMDLLRLARHDAREIVSGDPKLASAQNETLRRILLKQYGEALGLVDIA